MSEGEGVNPVELSQPTKHPDEVKSYVSQGHPEKSARGLAARDIWASRLKQRLSEAEQRAMTDVLTGLPNRGLFDKVLHQEFSHVTRMAKQREAEAAKGEPVRDPEQIGVVYFDIDRFKEVNDTYGHTAGDELLKKLADVLENDIRDEDILARLSGEEFALLIYGSDKMTHEQLIELVNRHQKTISGRINRPDGSPLTVSMGLARYPHKGVISSEQDLIDASDSAMYFAKHHGGRNCIYEYEGIGDGDDPSPRYTRISPGTAPEPEQGMLGKMKDKASGLIARFRSSS
jgi:diguanylate cyclase (GGDEF)-like protein